MAGESVVSFLLRKLDTLLVEEAKLLKGVSTEVRWIKDELQSMRAFLRDADARAESDNRVKIWVAQVREAAYDIEDILDEYALHLAQASIDDGHKVKFFLHKTKHFIKHLKMRHRIANQIQELRTHVIDISSRKANYDFKMINQGSSNSNALSDRASHLRSTARFVDEADLVSIENPRNELIRLLVGGESWLKTISIVGMGGLGKTTLAGKVYSSEQVKRHFEAFAWVTVSQTFSIEEIFRGLVKKFCGIRIEQEDEMGKKVIVPIQDMGKDDLIEKLRSHLQQKRYVIVLDDLWKVDDWECIRIGLPNGEYGSRIMVTTRINEVAAACAQTSDHVYNLPPLPSEQGWALFRRKAFQSDLGGNCPPELTSISEKFVQKCGGLPLAIVAVGSLLSNKPKTLVEWQKLYDNLGHQIESSSSLTSMNQILLLSYNDLPYYLKPCFMYVSMFPEDYLIRRMRLIQIWIAEGFVEKKKGMTLEEVADDYLHELINRSLIQVASYTDYGTIEACRVHDVVREIILSKAREEKFVTFPNSTELSDKTRHLAVSGNERIVPESNLSHVRSFFMFGRSRWSESLNTWFSGFILLKVLDLEGTGISNFPSQIVNLLHLRFLSLRDTQICSLPESICKLKNLETLNLQDTGIEELPASIVKLKYLRCLLVCPRFELIRNRFNRKNGFPPTEGSLKPLCNGVTIRELGKLTQLKWLGISKLRGEDSLGLCASIEKMPCLSSLAAYSVYEGVGSGYGLLDLKSLSSPPPLLTHVHLGGRLEEMPHWIPSLSKLVRLALEDSKLKEDPFSTLQHLPNLLELKLIAAYSGEELCCERGGFPRLKSLSLGNLPVRRLVIAERGAMQNLQKLRIERCIYLREVPFHIRHLRVVETTRDVQFSMGNVPPF